MKKIVKLSLIAILLAVVAIAITGCGAEEKDRTYNTLGKTLLGDTYILEIEGDALGGNGKSGTLTVAKKGDKILQEVKSDDGKVTIIFKDNATHIVIHDEKMYMKTDGKDESILSDDEAFLSKEELEALKTEEYKTGKEKIDDKEYYYIAQVNDEETDICDNYKIVVATYKDGEVYLDEVLGEDKLKEILPLFVKE